MKHTLLPLLFLLFGLRAVAQEISLTAAVDRETASVGEPVKYTVSFVNPPPGSTLSTPDMGGLVVLQGPYDNRYAQNIQGRNTFTVSRTWVVTNTQPGEFTIGAAVGQVGGGQLKTAPITLRFTKAEGAGVSNSLLDEGQKRNRDLFCVVGLSKNKAYVGEQVILTYTLYSRYQSLRESDLNAPKPNGAWIEDVPLSRNTQSQEQRTVNGLRYNVVVMKKQVLIPQRAGKLRIEPMSITLLVNASFFHPGTPVEVRSNANELQVLELPPGRPDDFIGAVGDLQLSTDLPRTTVKADEAIDLSLKFSGRANLRLIDAPKLALPTDFEAYDPKINDKVNVGADGMSGSREFQYLLIPRSAGEQDLGPITFSYFDPGSGQYKKLSTGPLRVTVTPGDGTTARTERPRQNDVQAVGNDIRYIRTGDLDLRPVGRFLFGSWAYMAGILAPVLALLGLATWQRKRRSDLSDATGMRRKGADKVARKHLKAAEEALRSDDRNGFYTSLGKALEGYFADRYDLGVAEVNPSTIQAKLGPLDDGRIAREYIGLLDECGSARFAPLEGRSRREIHDQAVALIHRIETGPRP